MRKASAIKLMEAPTSVLPVSVLVPPEKPARAAERSSKAAASPAAEQK